MAINLMCPNLRCRKILAVPDSARGSRVRCAYCQQILMVPATKHTIGGKSGIFTAIKGDVKVGKDKK